MAVKAQDIIGIMQSWIGTDKKKIIDLYNSYTPLAHGYKVQYTDAWCDTTVSACFIKAGAVDLIGGTECGVERHIQLFKNKGIWEEDGTVIPTPGAIVCYNWDDSTQPNDGFADHIGIVESVSGNNITIIEGNYNDAVRKRVIPIGWGYIRGYAFPKYGTDTQTVTAQPSVTGGAMKYSKNKPPLQCILTQSTCFNGTYKFVPKGVLWHSTGCNNPNLWRYVQPSNNDPDKDYLLSIIGKNNYGSSWNHATVYAGVNAFIGKLANGEVTTAQALPWDYAPWGCGGGVYGSANSTHIQFEICEDDLTSRDHFEKCYKEAVELTAYLCKLYNIDPYGKVRCGSTTIPTILCHVDAYNYGVGSGHGDVMHWFPKFGKNMDDVRNDVAKLLKKGQEPKKKDNTTNDISYRAHCQTYGWMPSVKNGAVAGTTGESKRLEAIKIAPPDGLELEVDAHIQTYGWKTYKDIKRMYDGNGNAISSGTGSSENDPIIGTVGESKRLEAIRIRCTKNTTGKKLRYQAHVQGIGWQNPVGEGELAGTTGQAKRLEAIKIWLE